MIEKHYTIADLSRLFGCTRSTIYNWLRDGLITSTSGKGKRLFTHDEVERFYANEYKGTKCGKSPKLKPIDTPLVSLQDLNERVAILERKMKEFENNKNLQK